MLCREQAAQFTEYADAITAKGADLVFIGNGESIWAGGFRDRFAPGQRVLSDPKRDAYWQLKMKKGAKTVWNPKTAAHGARATSKGFIQGRTRGVGFQQGGVLVMGPGDILHYLYRSDEAGDHPDPDEAIAAIPV